MTIIEDLTRRATLASPCTAKWEEMDGDQRQRFCNQCQLSVLNASEMSDEEVMLSIMALQTGKRVCMRIYRRADGTILTKDCPVGLRKKLAAGVRRAAAWLAGGLSMLLSLTTSAGAQECDSKNSNGKNKPRWHTSIKQDATNNEQKKTQIDGTTSGVKLVPTIPTPGSIAPPRYTDAEVKKGEQDVRDYEKKHGPQSIQVADGLESVGQMYYWQEKYDQSKVVYLRAFDVFQKLNDKIGMRRVCYQLSTLCQLQKDEAGRSQWKKRAAGYSLLNEKRVAQ
jgi:hypothetical protein